MHGPLNVKSSGRILFHGAIELCSSYETAAEYPGFLILLKRTTEKFYWLINSIRNPR